MKSFFIITLLSLPVFSSIAQEPSFRISFSLRYKDKTIPFTDSAYTITGQYCDSTLDSKYISLLSCSDPTQPGIISYCLWGVSRPSIEYALKVITPDKRIMEIVFHVSVKQKEIVERLNLGAIVFKEGTYEFKATENISTIHPWYVAPPQNEWVKK